MALKLLARRIWYNFSYYLIEIEVRKDWEFLFSGSSKYFFPSEKNSHL